MTDFCNQKDHNKPYLDDRVDIGYVAGLLGTFLTLAVISLCSVIGFATILGWIFGK